MLQTKTWKGSHKKPIGKPKQELKDTTKNKSKANKMVWSVSCGNSTKGITHEISLTFRHDKWNDIVKTLYMKHDLIPDDVTHEKVDCKYYILSGIEGRK